MLGPFWAANIALAVVNMAVVHAGQRNRTYRIALAPGRERDPRLLPAGHQLGLGRGHDIESRHGAAAANSSRMIIRKKSSGPITKCGIMRADADVMARP